MQIESYWRAITSDGLWHVWVCLMFLSLLLKSAIVEKMCFEWIVIFLQILYEVFLLSKRIEGYIVFNILRFSCQVLVMYIRYQLTCIFMSYIFLKTPNVQSQENPSEACSTGANTRMERKRQGWQGYMKKLTVAFRSFANGSKIRSSSLLAFSATVLPT
jgi:predicted membrane protein